VEVAATFGKAPGEIGAAIKSTAALQRNLFESLM
jgi:hypothetical protein